MRQFILAKKFGQGDDALVGLDSMILEKDEGFLGVIYHTKDGLVSEGLSTEDNSAINNANLVLCRKPEHGGPVVIPVHKNNFSYVRGDYSKATAFSGKFTVQAPTKIGDYSVIIVLKGVKFNERNKWTAMVHVTDVSITADALAKKITDAINSNDGHGVKATVAEAVVTVTAVQKGVDYEIIGADELFGLKVTRLSSGKSAYGDAAYIKDLADKAAADAGFEYTYQDANCYLYPNYPLNPLKGTEAADTGFTIFTLRFAEPRDVKTRDEVVNQIVQVAFPIGESTITHFHQWCLMMSGSSEVIGG